MIRRYVFACLFMYLFAIASVASPQDASNQAPLPGHLIKQAIRPNSIDLYGRAKNVGFPKVRPLYELAQSSGPSANAEPKVDSPASEPKTGPTADSTPAAPKPAMTVENEIEALKARLADLEQQVANATASNAVVVPGSTPTAAPGSAPQAATPSVPEGLQEPEASPEPNNFDFAAYGDFTWMNGTTRTHAPIFDTKFFTPEVRFDTAFMESFNQPKDHTLGGSTEMFRSGEVQIEQISVGGDFHWKDVRGRVLYMGGMFAVTTPRNDASPGVGNWDVRGAYKYTSEAWGGYHFNVAHGLNVDAGIFVSYIGLFSYYNFDNWTYQPSYVSSNTPWFFNGVRIQYFPTNKLKIEPWIINGWQSYNKYNGHGGLGGQILWLPKEWFKLVLNSYGNGEDTPYIARSRIHADDSIEIRYFNRPKSPGISKMAFSLTGDLGCEYGGGVSCFGNKPYDPITRKGGPKQAFLGFMVYNRIWFGQDKYAITWGGGRMSNPGLYLTLLPPINGADAISGSPYFPQSPGLQAHMYDSQLNLQWMPRENITWWIEGAYRHSDIPYFSGRRGITPPGGNNGIPSQFACMTGAPSGATDPTAAAAACGGPSNVWYPDLRHGQASLSAGVMVKF
jgi:Putative beta-barrel porin-2, OmpL-like. bbp2